MADRFRWVPLSARYADSLGARWFSHRSGRALRLQRVSARSAEDAHPRNCPPRLSTCPTRRGLRHRRIAGLYRAASRFGPTDFAMPWYGAGRASSALVGPRDRTQRATLSAVRLIRRSVSSIPWFTWRPRGMNISAVLFASEHHRNWKDSVRTVPEDDGSSLYCQCVSCRPVRSFTVVKLNSRTTYSGCDHRRSFPPEPAAAVIATKPHPVSRSVRAI